MISWSGYGCLNPKMHGLLYYHCKIEFKTVIGPDIKVWDNNELTKKNIVMNNVCMHFRVKSVLVMQE